MAKFEEVFEDTQALYTGLILNADLSRGVNIKILANNKLKPIFKVVKANDLVKHMTSEDVIILLNEKMFEQLTPEQKIIVAEESLCAISFDYDTQTLTIKKPDVMTFSGVLKKYTYATYEVLVESIKTLYQVEKDEADNAKATAEKARKEKSKKYA